MTDNNHPITPPFKLVREWQDIWNRATIKDVSNFEFVATQAARWGADEQLEMDATWVALQTSNQMSSKRLIAEMRPKPPSLKEKALMLLDDCSDRIDAAHENTIRRALEQLDD